VSKKTKKLIEPRKSKKKITEKTEPKKNRLNRLKFWKNRLVQFGFGFIRKKIKKTEPNQNRTKTKKNQKKTEPNRKNRAKTRKNRAKTGKTEPNQFEPVFALKNRTNRTKTDQFDPVSVRFRFFFKKNSVWLLFFYKNRTEPKMITPTLKSNAYISNIILLYVALMLLHW
jgi:hypothetical protein